MDLRCFLRGVGVVVPLSINGEPLNDSREAGESAADAAVEALRLAAIVSATADANSLRALPRLLPLLLNMLLRRARCASTSRGDGSDCDSRFARSASMADDAMACAAADSVVTGSSWEVVGVAVPEWSVAPLPLRNARTAAVNRLAAVAPCTATGGVLAASVGAPEPTIWPRPGM